MTHGLLQRYWNLESREAVNAHENEFQDIEKNGLA